MSRRGEKYLLCAWPPPLPATGTARAAGSEVCHPRWGGGRADSSLLSKSGQALGPEGSCAQGLQGGRSLLGKMTVQVLEGQVAPGEGAIQPARVPISESSQRGRPVLEPACETRAAPDGRAEGLPGGRAGGWGPRVGVCPFPSPSSRVVREPALGSLTVCQQGPEQAQAVDTDVPVPGEAVQAL